MLYTQHKKCTNGLLYLVTELPIRSLQDLADLCQLPIDVIQSAIYNGAAYRDMEECKWLSLFTCNLQILLQTPFHQSEDNRLLEARLYRTIETYNVDEGMARHGKVMITVGMSTKRTNDTEFDAWYRQEHINLLAKCPGWQRSRRCTLIDGQGPYHMAIHEYDQDPFGTDEFALATNTKWRSSIMSNVIKKQRRVFVYHSEIET